MSYGIILLPAAESDVLKAFAWYRKESAGLEWKFWDTISQALLRISKHPTHFTPASPDVRIAFVKRFPYKIIFYTNEAMHRVEIIAVVHNKRHPRVWKRRI